MKKNSLTSYVTTFINEKSGEDYTTILGYFVPEFITNLIIYSLPLWIDTIFISYLQSTPTYATLGVTNNILHLVIKVAEALAVSTVVLSGQFNGQKEYKLAGRTMRDAFWVTCFLGFFFFFMLYHGSYYIYRWYNVSADIIALGVPFLRIRAIGVLFMFICFAFIGFLRGIKNTRSPMKIFIAGALIFVVMDYCLIFGKAGFPALGLQGSAIATAVQYGFMMLIALWYVISNPKNRKYSVELFSVFTESHEIKKLLHLSVPVVIDKATLAIAYIWLGKMMAPMGTCVIASFCAIKDIERFAFLPAIAFAQVITFLASNGFGAQDWQGIKSNTKKIILLGSAMVTTILLGTYIWADKLLYLIDKKGDFTPFVMQALPLISLLVIFDLFQLILSGALRGTGNVKTVMKVRAAICFCYFIPVSFIISNLAIAKPVLKFLLIYGSFYIGNALMSLMYIYKFRSNEWKTDPH